jgi:hypothetical protein
MTSILMMMQSFGERERAAGKGRTETRNVGLVHPDDCYVLDLLRAAIRIRVITRAQGSRTLASDRQYYTVY